MYKVMLQNFTGWHLIEECPSIGKAKEVRDNILKERNWKAHICIVRPGKCVIKIRRNL